MGANDELIYVGGYTGDKGGAAEGIGLLRRDPASGVLTRLGVAARTPSPSFLAQHPTLPVLYAVNELEPDGTVSAFRVAEDGELTPLAVQPTGGSDPAHVSVTSDGQFLLVANYSSGSVAVHPLDPEGAPGERSDLLDLEGSGPDAERQSGSHAHMVVADRGAVLVADLGADRVWRCRLDPVSGRLTMLTPAVTAKPGTGPRHLRHAPDGTLLLVGELAANLTWYRPAADGSLELAGELPSSAQAGPTFPSEITCGRDGRFLYVANRGPNTVATFAWDGERATPLAEVSTGGDWPRHMVLLGDHLYVANQLSQTVTTLRIDRETGIPEAEGEATAEASPTCLLRWTSMTVR
ncbi:lactonase family protein [Paractinoplanes rhizophilus]|uniref:Lactonase family protein n=1 Tax=Paractinoplanes rhizophilus TaxID=1416877 RepID=A0ABW2HV48_9ACTN|nr:lactonase family protein [Actinoplanes sp.]